MIAFLLFSIVKVAITCIPTQEVEPIDPVSTTTTTSSTTTTTTTTTTTEATTTTLTLAPNPCTMCAPIYNTGCMGVGMPSPTDWCVIGDDIPVTYSLVDDGAGLISCETTLQCPTGTFAYFVAGTEMQGSNGGTDSYTVSCEESGGFYIGIWRLVIGGIPTPITQATCRNM